ncbi:hypothetical protein [Pseudocitrobacter faecalis]|uniref:hypothetical protein n=1 Tax=Pseudocitrobacter faecalis TaxID=1398493 RepID=UPI001674E606|nr:hypothetical protein [Pseudocitrobacter faecalis]
MMTTLLPDFATPSSSILLHGERHPDACTLSGSLFFPSYPGGESSLNACSARFVTRVVW